MSRLLLVKHALPEVRPNVPARDWLLGEKGRRQSLLLAERLRPHSPAVIISSEEPKAAETGEIVAEVLNLPCHTAPDLHEHDRTGVPYFDNPTDFEAEVKAFFERPDERVFGTERADEAQLRFLTAVQGVLEPHPIQTVILVAHGTVNTLFVTAHNPVAPFELWRAWPLGGFAVLSRPGFGLLERPATLE